MGALLLAPEQLIESIDQMVDIAGANQAEGLSRIFEDGEVRRDDRSLCRQDEAQRRARGLRGLQVRQRNDVARPKESSMSASRTPRASSDYPWA
jgi:hypothetical protein